MIEYYFFIKSIHFISIVCWFAGLFYLPRLFVYHCGGVNNKQMNETFKIMERKLLHYIMYPSMIAVILSGIAKKEVEGWPTHDDWWFVISMIGNVILILYQFLLHKHLLDFKNNKNKLSPRYFKIINEIPTVMLIIIVFNMYYKFSY